MEFKHYSVMLPEVIEYLDIKEGGTYVDATIGGGGHSLEIVKRIGRNGRLIGFDQDQEALSAAKERLKEYMDQVTLVHQNFRNIKAALTELHVSKVDGIVYDLGVSSYQLDNRERGFSYLGDNPLDMRMDMRNALSAYDVVNQYEEEELAQILFIYGEEKFSRRIARNIAEARKEKPISTTKELVDIIEKSIPKSKRQPGSHVAKRTFQAIRIEVNGELKILEEALRDGVAAVKKGGRIAVITFHSLEDRIVKNVFKDLATDCICSPELPVCVCDHRRSIQLVTRKPIYPSKTELAENSRSKSAKLRVAEKVAE